MNKRWNKRQANTGYQRCDWWIWSFGETIFPLIFSNASIIHALNLPFSTKNLHHSRWMQPNGLFDFRVCFNSSWVCNKLMTIDGNIVQHSIVPTNYIVYAHFGSEVIKFCIFHRKWSFINHSGNSNGKYTLIKWLLIMPSIKFILNVHNRIM